MKFKDLTEIPDGKINLEIEKNIKDCYGKVAHDIEKLEFRQATEEIMKLIEETNKFYDDQKPWVQKKEDISGFANTIYTCAVVIANVSNLFEPFMPSTCSKIRKFLKIEKPVWEYITIEPGIQLNDIEPLFTRI